ncbi:unnamed protein product [Brachionus calyciflorus]|uniref:Uncharacterized protein n=1 Tax=Brachionus calyciflorus TaxID=104777 RepID=A0A813M568_9BILA|nr:unnamed protein product [Brachionus calyciflorus]
MQNIGQIPRHEKRSPYSDRPLKTEEALGCADYRGGVEFIKDAKILGTNRYFYSNRVVDSTPCSSKTIANPLPVNDENAQSKSGEQEVNNKNTYSSRVLKNVDKKVESKKSRIVVGNLNVASRNYHFYVGNWSRSTTCEQVTEYINSFAKINKIEESTTKYGCYRTLNN